MRQADGRKSSVHVCNWNVIIEVPTYKYIRSLPSLISRLLFTTLKLLWMMITGHNTEVWSECWWHLQILDFPCSFVVRSFTHHLFFWFWAAWAMLRRVFSYTSSCACTRIRWLIPPMTFICPCDCCRHSNDPCFSSSAIAKLNFCSIGWLLPLFPSVGNDRN